MTSILTLLFFAVVEAMNGGVGLFGPGMGLDRVSPGMVIDVASLILQVCLSSCYRLFIN